jgi:hypothetical protein
VSVGAPEIDGRVGVPFKAQIRHEYVTHLRASLCSNGSMRELSEKPTVRQVYALAAALCERAGEGFPETREGASELIERLRIEGGHPAPRLEDVPLRSRRGRRWRGDRGPGGGVGDDERRASAAAAELAREMR